MEKFFLYKCKLSLSLALLYLVDLFINKLKTKLNNLFYRMIFNRKRLHNFFWRNFPARAKQMPSIYLSARKSDDRAVRSLRAKIVIGNSKWVHYLTVLVYTKTISIQGVPKVRSSYYMRHNFWSKLHFCIKFVKDVYCFTEYIYSESQYPACLPLFVITFQSRCGMEWDIKVM